MGFDVFFSDCGYVINFLFLVYADRRYQEAERKKRELANRKIEQVEIGNRLWEEEIFRRRELSAQDFQSEMHRREREKKLLTEFADLRARTRTENASRFREQLQKQCVSIFINVFTFSFFFSLTVLVAVVGPQF